MKILKIHDFVAERIKVQPVTNIELDKAEQDMIERKLHDSNITLCQGDIVNITYRNRYYLVITDLELLEKFGIVHISDDYRKGALVSYTSAFHHDVHRMKLKDYVGADFTGSSREFDIVAVWRPNEQIEIKKKTLVEDNLKAETKTSKYKTYQTNENTTPTPIHVRKD